MIKKGKDKSKNKTFSLILLLKQGCVPNAEIIPCDLMRVMPT